MEKIDLSEINISDIESLDKRQIVAKFLWDIYKPKGNKRLTRIISDFEKEESTPYSFEEWLERHHKQKLHDSKRSHQFRILEVVALHGITEDPVLIQRYEQTSIQKQKAAVQYTYNFLHKLNQYIDDVQKEKSGKALKDTPSRSSTPAPTHYAYFLYYHEDEWDQEPVIGRAVVSIPELKQRTSKDIKEQKFTASVNFINTKADTSRDYMGGVDFFPTASHPILIFNIESNVPGRKLHIKLYSGNPKEEENLFGTENGSLELNQEVSVGLYITFENALIQGGTIIFQKLDDSIKEPKTGVFSFFENRADFINENEIPDQVKEFFAYRSNSYFLVPKNISTLNDLVLPSKISSYQFAKKALFLEKKEPEIFISYPITGNKSYNKAFLKQVKEDIKLAFPEFSVEANTKGKGFMAGKPQPDENLKQLKSTRVFVFFAGDLEAISFSYIQLGWALLYCKQVIVIGKRTNFSTTLRHLPDEYMEKIFLLSDLKLEELDNPRKPWKKRVLPKLRTFIYHSLDKSLDLHGENHHSRAKAKNMKKGKT